MKFCIHRVSNRGEESIWKSWRWASEKPNQKWNHLIQYVTISSNDNVLALIVRPGTIGLVLDEKKVSEEIKDRLDGQGNQDNSDVLDEDVEENLRPTIDFSEWHDDATMVRLGMPNRSRGRLSNCCNSYISCVSQT